MTEFNLGIVIAAWLTGLAGGGGHCVGMCGGIVGAIGMRAGTGGSAALRIAAAHIGRIASYSAAGAIAGFAGAAFIIGLFGPNGMAVLRIAAALMIGLIGVQLLFGLKALTAIERGGARVWRHLAPYLQRLLPRRDLPSAFAVGALWGWLPCGLVYAELAVAAASGGAASGAVVMAAFGAGTLVSLSLVSALLQSAGMTRLPRQASGALLVLFAAWTALPFMSP